MKRGDKLELKDKNGVVLSTWYEEPGVIPPEVSPHFLGEVGFYRNGEFQYKGEYVIEIINRRVLNFLP